jgi:uncharacterized OB-fold protein
MAPLIQRKCDYCGEVYRPSRCDQRYCSAECRREAKIAAQRAAVALWRELGRPMPEAEIITPQAPIAEAVKMRRL